MEKNVTGGIKLSPRPNRVKVHIHFRKFFTERKIFRGPHAQYDFFYKKIDTRRNMRSPRKIFRSVENFLKCICTFTVENLHVRYCI